MKVTFFIGSLYGGGAERVTCNLANYLVDKGHDVEILVVSETNKSYELDPRINVTSLLSINERKNKFCNILKRFPRFWLYLLNTKNDIYVVMLPKTIILLLLFKWLTKAKVIASERVAPTAYSKLIAFFLKLTARFADGFLFQTEEARSWYGDNISKIKTKVIPNAINRKFIGRNYKGVKRKYICGVGRLDYQKNFSLLISAFEKISLKYPDYYLIIYGEGNERSYLENLITSYGLKTRVILAGNVSNIEEELERNTMFVLSSNFEGMPNSLMEAMALGLPCISTDCPCGGPRYLIENGFNGLLVPINDESKMVEAISKILDDKEFADRLGKEASKIVDRLSSEKIYASWEAFMEMVVYEHKKVH